VSINYTATSPITAWITTTDGYTDPLQEEEVAVLAFGWADAQPEKATGVWVLGAKTGGVTFIPARAIQLLEPCTPEVEAALKRTEATAVNALDLASESQAKVARVMREVQVAEDVAVGAAEVAIETAEEVGERDAAQAVAAAEPEVLAGPPGDRPPGASQNDDAAAKSRSGAAGSSARSSASSKTASRTSARRGAKGKAKKKVS
jgi:hypothetical protein